MFFYLSSVEINSHLGQLICVNLRNLFQTLKVIAQPCTTIVLLFLLDLDFGLLYVAIARHLGHLCFKYMMVGLWGSVRALIYNHARQSFHIVSHEVSEPWSSGEYILKLVHLVELLKSSTH